MLGAFFLYKKTVFIIVPLLIISLVFNGIQFSNNKAYEAYLTEELNNMVSSLSSSILKSEEILLDVVEQKQLTKEQADDLYKYLRSVGLYHQEILFLGQKTKKIAAGSSEVSNRTATELMPQLRRYLQHFFDENAEETATYSLSKNDLKNIENIVIMSVEIADVVRANIPGASTSGMPSEYWNDPKVRNSVNEQYWINVLKAIDQYSFHTLVYY